jgi:hypothetical protein
MVFHFLGFQGDDDFPFSIERSIPFLQFQTVLFMYLY